MTITPMSKDPLSYFSGISIGKYNTNSDSILVKLAKTGKMRDLFISGPSSISKVSTCSLPWSKLDFVRTNCLRDKVYTIMDDCDGEGCTVWMLRVDDSLYSNDNKVFKQEFIDIMNKEIKNKSFTVAYNSSQKLIENNNPPFAIAAVISMKYNNPLPFFGKTVWGIALKDDIISLSQIPTMLGNKTRYATWFFVSKELISQDDLFNRFGKSGKTEDYERFKELRKYLNEKCYPLNNTGKYESILREVHECSFSNADAMFENEVEYKIKTEDEENNLDSSTHEMPKGEPFKSKFIGSPSEIGPMW